MKKPATAFRPRPVAFSATLVALIAVTGANCPHVPAQSRGDTTTQIADENARLKYAMQEQYDAIDLSLFEDSIHHWQMKDGRDRNDLRYRPDQIVHIAENFLRFQNADGGWPANLDWLAIVDIKEIAQIRNGTVGQSTFDNRNIYPQIEYLSHVFNVTGMQRYRSAANRGLEYLLQEQRPTGGWRGRDVDAVTFNDDVMVGIMKLLLRIREGATHFAWLSPELKLRLSQSLDQAVDVTLKCQIVENGRKTAWCQQHDHLTFKPIKARSYELPSVTALESVGVVRFLMEFPDPSDEMIGAIDCAVAWFEAAKIQSLRIETVSIAPVRFKGFTAKFDRKAAHDDLAPPIWARFYEIDTDRPFFCNRDGMKVYSLSEVELERRVGYRWYGYWPAELLTRHYPAWKARMSSITTRQDPVD